VELAIFMTNTNVNEALVLLDIHYRYFFEVNKYAEKYGHPHPSDSRAWSQLIVSVLTGIHGLERKKGADLVDGSDVKAASTWAAIDTPRFNGVIKAGTKSQYSGKLESLDIMPFIFFVLWDYEPDTKNERCRIWVVRTKEDSIFRDMCRLWYKKKHDGEIVSNNFQLHPPRNINSNVFRNTCGNLSYPLLFEAKHGKSGYECIHYDPSIMISGECVKIED
jgi:hypothetical protein